MTTEFATNLALLQAKQGSPIDLQRIQNESLRLALEEVRSLLTEQKMALHALTQKLERRTSVLSPTKAFSNELYDSRLELAQGTSIAPPIFPSAPSVAPQGVRTGDCRHMG